VASAGRSEQRRSQSVIGRGSKGIAEFGDGGERAASEGQDGLERSRKVKRGGVGLRFVVEPNIVVWMSRLPRGLAVGVLSWFK
jgi:hypothetical protein